MLRHIFCEENIVLHTFKFLPFSKSPTYKFWKCKNFENAKIWKCQKSKSKKCLKNVSCKKKLKIIQKVPENDNHDSEPSSDVSVTDTAIFSIIGSVIRIH